MPASRHSKILGLGNACRDTLLRVVRLPGRGEKIELQSESHSTGGQVASALVGCQRLGLRTEFLLRSGEDAAGEQIRAAMRAAGIGLQYARTMPGVASATAYVIWDAVGERAVVWSIPAGLALTPGEITPALFEDVAALFFDGRDGAACLRAAQMARERGIPVVADLDCHYPHTAELLEWVDHLVSPAEFGAKASDRRTVVITNGAAGATGWEPGRPPVHAPAFPVPVVDTTGAGDAFHAGYLYGLVQGWEFAPRLRFANATAALACRAVGSQAGLPQRNEVEQLLARFPEPPPQ